MKIKTQLILLLGCALPLLAHHQFSSEFDRGRPLSLSGTVTKVDWVNPHAYVYINTTNQSGKTEQWKLELASTDYLSKEGLKSNSFKKGEQISVSAYAANNEPHVASARQVTLPDGKTIETADVQNDGGPSK